MKILVATGNPHKFKELVHILPATLKNGTQVKYLSLADFDNLELPPETGSSLEANAEQKAVFAAFQKSSVSPRMFCGKKGRMVLSFAPTRYFRAYGYNRNGARFKIRLGDSKQ